MAGTQDEQTLRGELAEAYRHLGALGLNELASGNVSCRLGDGMLISPTGATADNIKADKLVKMSLDGRQAGSRKPSSEWRMHAAIYQQQGAAMAVVHTHSDHCVALSCQRRALPGFHYLVGSFGGQDVPCVPYATFGSEELAKEAAGALTATTACLLGSHGMICRGANLQAAVASAQLLELLCRQYLLACQLGEPQELTAEEWQDFFQRFNEMGYGVAS